MRLLAKLVLAAALSLVALPAFAQDFIAGIPRNEALIIQGPTAQNADWFNLWAPAAAPTSTATSSSRPTRSGGSIPRAAPTPGRMRSPPSRRSTTTTSPR